MRILVTGGTGFTGRALVLRLLDEGHSVVALDYKEGYRTADLRDAGAEVVIGSVADADAVRRAMTGAEVVHHLAAAFREMNVPDTHYQKINVEGTRIVMEAAREFGVRKVVNCSTCGVHGNVDRPPGGEDAPIQPADYYQRTKYEGEVVAQSYDGKGLRVTTLRPAAIYGPGDPERFTMIFRQVAKGSFPMFGSGRTFYHPLYIDNLVDAFLLAMQEGKGDGRSYLIADEHYLPIKDLVRKAGQALGVDAVIRYYPILPLVVAGHVCETVCKPFKITPPIFPRRVDWFRQNRAFDISRAKRELDYRPRIDIDEGLKRTAEWCVETGLIKPSRSRRTAAQGGGRDA